MNFSKRLSIYISNIFTYTYDYRVNGKTEELEQTILDYIELYAKQINNVICLSFEDMSYIFKILLNNIKEKNMYPAVTLLYNLQCDIFDRRLEIKHSKCFDILTELIDRVKTISPQDVNWFKNLKIIFDKYFIEDSLINIANAIDNKYFNIYDKKLYEYNFMSDYFYNKNDIFAYDISCLNKSTFSAVLRNIVLQFYYLIHDMYNKLQNAHDDNDVNEVKQDFIKKEKQIMNNLLQICSRYNYDKEIFNIIVDNMKVLISVLRHNLNININYDILSMKS